MKKCRGILFSVFLSLLLTGCGKAGMEDMEGRNEQPAADAAEETSRQVQEAQTTKGVEAQPDVIRENINLYGSFQGLYGCAVIYNPQEQRYSFYRETLAEQETSPYSTFKIVSALAGLENQIVENETSTMNYSGAEYPVSAWNENLTLKEAFQSSCVWYFRQVADAVGRDEMKAELEALQYGNCDISQWEGSGVNGMAELNGFWLDSSLKISPLEQVQVLAKIFEGQSAYGEKNVAVLKELMLTDDNGIRKIYGKTGSGFDGKAWFVGFAEEDGQKTYFAVYLDDGNHTEEVSGEKAREIALSVLDSRDKTAFVGMDDVEIYRAFVEKNFPYGITSTLLSDLTGDGRQELIVINNHIGGFLPEDTEEARVLREEEKEETARDTRPVRNTATEYPESPAYGSLDYMGIASGVSMSVYGIKDDKTVVSLYEDEASSSHAGWNWLYLYEEDGKNYLFRYLPVMYQGMGSYTFDIFSLTEGGEEVPLYSGEEPVNIAGGEVSEEFLTRIAAFLEQVHAYQKVSIPLVEIGEDYFNVEYGTDDVRRYNYVIDYDELGIRKQ